MCDLLGEEASTDVEPKGARYAFKKGATKTTGGEGWPPAAAALERLRESPGGSRPHENVDGRIKSDQIRPGQLRVAQGSLRFRTLPMAKSSNSPAYVGEGTPMLQRLKDVVGLEIGISREDFSLGPSTIRTIPGSSPGLSLSAGMSTRSAGAPTSTASPRTGSNVGPQARPACPWCFPVRRI
jgi:hypothetical protein